MIRLARTAVATFQRQRRQALCVGAGDESSRWASVAGSLSACLLAAILLFAQAVDLSHSHEGDLQPRFDCEICLVTGTLGHALSAGEFSLASASAAQSFDIQIANWHSTFVVAHKARAPPLS